MFDRTWPSETYLSQLLIRLKGPPTWLKCFPLRPAATVAQTPVAVGTVVQRPTR